jgi:ribosome-associated toxin RatA of RatAB toxin-antitoxin module
MTTIHKSALVPYSAEQMYTLVDNVLAYPEFLPWCNDSKEIMRNEHEVEASLDIAHSGIHKSFTTHNHLEKNRLIKVQLVEGPFKHLNGMWRFQPLGDAGSRVELDLEFDFSSKLLSVTFGPVFNKIASTLMDAFIQRAQKVYG